MAEILLISHEWQTRALVKAQLEEEGHQVTGVALLAEAVGRLTQGQASFGLVILDTLGQPCDEGSLARLREAAASASIIVLTGPYDLAQGDFGALDFQHMLVRPFFIGDLVRLVAQVFGNAPPRR